MLALVSRLYAEKLGIVYVLVDEEKKLHTISSESYLYKIRNKVVNYQIDRVKRENRVTNAWSPASMVLNSSSPVFKTKDYFDIRDISVELYYARIGTLIRTGHTKKSIIDYEVQKWIEKDREEYSNSDWLINQANTYLRQMEW